jgi:hypothetical protein
VAYQCKEDDIKDDGQIFHIRVFECLGV